MGEVNNAEVYQDSAAELVESVRGGGMGTMFMFGQTGSGKTHTMTAIEEMAARDLFAGADAEVPWVAVQFIELRGDQCYDLLASGISVDGRRKGGEQRPRLQLRELKNGTYIADGAVDLMPKSPEELCAIVQMAHARRKTSATDANDTSSRSHAVCTLRLLQSQGQLMLVDCAGTERRKDSMYHSKERQTEGAEINASLHALKECIRYLATKHEVPSHVFRGSSLTKVLAEAFSRGKRSQLVIVCTASPCASDTEHTLTTLRTGVSLCVGGLEREERQALLEYVAAQKKPHIPHPKSWTAEQVRSWLAALEEGKFQDVLDALPSNFTGQMLVRLTESRCVQLCGGDQKRGRFFFDLLHEEIRRER